MGEALTIMREDKKLRKGIKRKYTEVCRITGKLELQTGMRFRTQKPDGAVHPQPAQGDTVSNPLPEHSPPSVPTHTLLAQEPKPQKTMSDSRF